MDSPPTSASSSGSFDGAAFARLLLESDTSTPPRITRFSFEDDHNSDNLSASLSGQFNSFYGLPYDHSPPPCQDAASEHSSRGPDTPPAPDHLAFLSNTPSPLSAANKSNDDSFARASTTFFLDAHSLPPSHSLLTTTPSFLGLQDMPISPVRTHWDSSATPPRLFRPQAQPMSITTSRQIQQTISSDAGPTLEPMRTSVNRGVTVQQLALDLPMSRSRSGSLTALVRALEDASPGWYQSLMDSALPRAGSLSPLSPSPQIPPVVVRQVPRTPPSPTRPTNRGQDRELGALFGSSSSSTFGDLEELEALALTISRLPIPRPGTMALDIVETVFFQPSSIPLPEQVAPHSWASPPNSPNEDTHHSAAVQGATLSGEQSLLHDASCGQALSTASSASSCNSTAPPQPAAANFAHYPKLTKTLGLRSVPSLSSLLAPAPKTPSWRKRSSSRSRASTEAVPQVPAFPPSLPAYPKTPTKKAGALPKTPKSAKLQSFFRRRPTAPPVPIQEYDLGDSARPLVFRPSHLSEPGIYRLARGSPPGKSVRHFSTAPELPPLPPQQHSTLGSFLPM